MAKQSRGTFQKREKERARQQKQHDKAQRRLAAKSCCAVGATRMEDDEPQVVDKAPRAARGAYPMG